MAVAVVAMCVAAFAMSSALADPVTVTNPSFEDDGLIFWTTPSGWTSVNTDLGARDAANANGVVPTDGTYQLFLNGGNTIYQDTGVVIVEGTTYTLTVDVTTTPPFDGHTGTLRLYGSTLGFGTAIGGAETSKVTAQSVWTTETASFIATATEAGQTLGIALSTTAGTQAEWDYVRVEAQAPAGTVDLSGDTVASNAAPGTLVGNLSMVNTNGTFTYALDASGDYTYFDISTGTTNLRTAVWIDSDSYDISIIGTESGGGGLVVTNDFTINVDPVAANKMAFVVAADVQSGAADGTVVGTAQTDVSGATFSIIDGREDLFYMDGADLKLTNSSDWGSIGTTNYVRLQASVGAATNELVVAAGVISGASSGTIFMFR